ncbi:hypothetical protein [Lysinibacillus sp. ACHW1.5]|uniref:hypothetical protein n=1 Tax=Lysinibacillus sp. ACHW1.5 TaxID=2913506 RepID=UPI001EDBB50B|nr:hypothetical protein [Lysinibacillus sp. ACHW1.5]UKJ43480.1 hypothetical protein L6W14_11915 [Lysinibacillus sp. ACHW1.5]
MFKIFKAILRTAGKTPDDIKQMYDGSVGPEPSEEEIQGYIDVYNKLDGLEVVVYDRGQFGVADYGLYVWQKEDDERIRELFYQAEQDPYFGTYVNERDEFIKDWEAEEYEFGPSPTFRADDVEIIEEILLKSTS